MARRKPWIRDRRLALLLGYGGLIIGTIALHDAYENRGRSMSVVGKLVKPGG